MHNLITPYQLQIDALEKAGYALNEIEAFKTGYMRARGQHPDKYTAGWLALDHQRTKNNKAQDSNV